jgi:hypothetical protein
LVKFAQGFVDACHHSVEELILFHGAVRGGSLRGAWRSSTLPGGPATRAHSPSF